MQIKERTQSPIEGNWFNVNPEEIINKKIFARRRYDKKQEETRLFILEAFKEVECNPDRYDVPFRTLMPEKNWALIDYETSEIIAKQLDGHVANWVEQGLEWAQRIYNGDSWKSICNEPDKSKWYRIIIWKNNNLRLVGGSYLNNMSYSVSDVCNFDFDFNDKFRDSVPLIASRK